MTKTELPEPQFRGGEKTSEATVGESKESKGPPKFICETHPAMASAEQSSAIAAQLLSGQLQKGIERRASQSYHEVPRP